MDALGDFDGDPTWVVRLPERSLAHVEPEGQMIRGIGWLALGTLAGFAVMYLPMRFLAKEPPLEVIALAAAICFVPGLIVLIATRPSVDRPVEVKIISILLATGFRMTAVIVSGVLLYFSLEVVEDHAAPFISWSIVFYLVTLFVETRLLYTEHSGSVNPPTER